MPLLATHSSSSCFNPFQEVPRQAHELRTTHCKLAQQKGRSSWVARDFCHTLALAGFSAVVRCSCGFLGLKQNRSANSKRLLSATPHPKVQPYSEKPHAHSGLSALRNSRQGLRIWLLRIQNIPAFIFLGLGTQPLWSAQSTSSFREMVSQLWPGFPAGHCLHLRRGCEGTKPADP